MRSLKVIVVRKLCKTLGDGRPTADPRVMKAVDSHFESMKPLVDEVSVDVVQVIAQPDTKEDSQVAVAIN